MGYFIRDGHSVIWVLQGACHRSITAWSCDGNFAHSAEKCTHELAAAVELFEITDGEELHIQLVVVVTFVLGKSDEGFELPAESLDIIKGGAWRD